MCICVGIPPELLLRTSSMKAACGMVYFEVALLRANRDPPGGTYSEYPDVCVHLFVCMYMSGPYVCLISSCLTTIQLVYVNIIT